MSTPMSVELDQDDFSATPHYSIDSPPVVLGEAELPVLQVGHPVSAKPAHDRVVVSVNDEDTSVFHHAEAIAEILSGRIDDNVCTQPVFLEPDIAINWTERSSFTPILWGDFLHSVVNTFYYDLTRGCSASPSLNVWVALTLATCSSTVQQYLDKVSLDKAALEYFAILSDFLTPLSFAKSDEYEDRLGGRVTDYFMGKERITCIVSVPHVQMLSYLSGTFEEKLFDRAGSAKPAIVAYLEDLLGEGKDDRLGSAENG